MPILALEASTSNIKAMLYSPTQGVLKMAEQPYAHLRYGTTAVQDPWEIYEQLTQLGRALAAGNDIEMVALSTTWHSVMLTDRDMVPVTPVYMWNFDGAQKICEEFRKVPEQCDTLYRRTGAITHECYPCYKLLWLRQQGIKLRDCHIFGIGSYLTWLLSGKRVVLDSMASGSGLFCVSTRDWDESWLSLLGIQREQLCRIVPYTEQLRLSADGSRALGLPEGTPLLASGSDGGLDQLGADAMVPGVMTLSMGTSGSLRLSTQDTPYMSRKPGTWCYLSPLGGWLSGVGTSGCCNCVDWLKSRFFQTGESYSEIECSISKYPDAPIFLPFVFGERGPEWRGYRRGRFVDLCDKHDRYALYYSVLEGTIFNLLQCFHLLCETSGTPHTIKISGGVLNSPMWSQMCADIFGKEMTVIKEKHSSLLGAALLAARALGIEALHGIERHGEFLLPHNENKFYQERYERYLTAFAEYSEDE